MTRRTYAMKTHLKNRREPRLREKRDAGYPDDSVKIGKKHYIIYKDRRDWYGFEVDRDGNQIGDSIFDPRKSELKKMILRFQEEVELNETLILLKSAIGNKR